MVALVVALGALVHAGSASATDAARPFRYDADLRKCVNAGGEEGLNPSADPSTDGECADFRGRELMYLHLEHGNFRGANFDGAQFRYLNSLARSDLTGASLRNVIANVVDLREANLSGADLSTARLRPCPGPDRGACVQDARIDARTLLPFPRKEAFVRGMVAVDRSERAPDAAAHFRYDAARGKCLNARGAEGLNQPARLAPRDSECADYRGVTLTYLRAEGGNFRGASFDGADLLYLMRMARADFTGARLRDVTGDSLDLRSANFSGADLTGAHLAPCGEARQGVCLEGARFDARTMLPFSRAEALARGMVAE